MKHSPLIAVLLAALTLAGPAFARPHDDKDREREEKVERRNNPRISLDQAVSMAERRFNARVVRADSRQEGDRVVYILRLLNDSGRVWTVKVDAASGAMN